MATVTLPPGAIISNLVGYTGEPGSHEQAVTITRTSDNTATFRTQRALGPGEGMSFAVAFQKGILVAPTGLDGWLQWLSDLREVILPIIGVLLVIFYNLLPGTRSAATRKRASSFPFFMRPRASRRR